MLARLLCLLGFHDRFTMLRVVPPKTSDNPPSHEAYTVCVRCRKTLSIIPLPHHRRDNDA
jgi:hypothetical protein